MGGRGKVRVRPGQLGAGTASCPGSFQPGAQRPVLVSQGRGVWRPMGSDPQALGVLAGLLGQGRAEERQVRCGRRARKPRTLVSSLACRLVCFFLFFFSLQFESF